MTFLFFAAISMVFFLAPEVACALFVLTDVARSGRGYAVAVVIASKIGEDVTEMIVGGKW
jgi:hypothetical protein